MPKFATSPGSHTVVGTVSELPRGSDVLGTNALLRSTSDPLYHGRIKAKPGDRRTLSKWAAKEKKWDARHGVCFSAANDVVSANDRSYFGRWRDPDGYKNPPELDGYCCRWVPTWKQMGPAERHQPKKHVDRREGRWNARHPVVYSKDNEKYTTNVRSYFDRTLEPFHPGPSTGPERERKLEITWTLGHTDRGVGPFPRPMVDPEGEDFQVPALFSTLANDENSANFRSYFDRMRERRDERAGSPPRPPLTITWKEEREERLPRQGADFDPTKFFLPNSYPRPHCVSDRVARSTTTPPFLRKTWSTSSPMRPPSRSLVDPWTADLETEMRATRKLVSREVASRAADAE